MSATTFSAASKFQQGQYVSALGQTGIAVGWKRGHLGKVVVVKFTSGSRKGRTIGVEPTLIEERKGRKGSGPLRLLKTQ